MVTFWQHHPALSYVFSGRFIGPTSQAPRVDEGRAETLYELEIAFGELERMAGQAASASGSDDGSTGTNAAAPPWLVDRLLRHLLADITGNTHRCEFCIDKLFSPDSERGRLGLLELRGFEMPPHPRMALVQALLVRSLVARFWEQPYQGPLVRWGTRLHDRFLLPAFAAEDLGEVVADLREHGFMLRAVLVRPVPGVPLPPDRQHRRGRRPDRAAGSDRALARARRGGLAVGGTSRYVDSSVERVQVRSQGLVEGRHAVTCNGVPVPLVQHLVRGEAVGGVRYRAWQPPRPCTRPSGCTRRWSSTWSTCGTAGRWAAAPTTWCTRAAAPTTGTRSTRPRPRPGAAPGSSRPGTPRARSTPPAGRRPSSSWGRAAGVPVHPGPAASGKRPPVIGRLIQPVLPDDRGFCRTGGRGPGTVRP